MKLFQTLREKSKSNREKELKDIAKERITVADFNGNQYIAFDMFPLFKIDDSLTSKEILEVLNSVRNVYYESQKDAL